MRPDYGTGFMFGLFRVARIWSFHVFEQWHSFTVAIGMPTGVIGRQFPRVAAASGNRNSKPTKNAMQRKSSNSSTKDGEFLRFGSVP
jgi:hypothetical protein